MLPMNVTVQDLWVELPSFLSCKVHSSSSMHSLFVRYVLRMGCQELETLQVT